MNFIDKAPIAGLRRTDDGYAVAEVPVARTGIQDYAGFEVGRPDLARVAVYRPPETVFDEASMATAAHKPITDDHPAQGVTAANWDGLAKGWTGETIRKDEAAGLLYVPMMLADGKLIDKLEAGKREVSCGYTCELVWGDGTTPDGMPYQATQKSVKFNHVAVVDKGRAGNVCRVGDNWQPLIDNKEPSVATKTIKIASVADGMPFEVTDAAEAIINSLVAARDAANVAKSEADAKVVERDASIVAKDAEITKLTADLAAAAITPEKLRDAAKSYADTMAKAKALGATVTDATSEADAMKAVVDAKMGDKAKGYTADQVALAFNVLTADVKIEAKDAFRSTIESITPQNMSDAQKQSQSAYDAMVKGLETGYKGKDAA